MTIISVVFTIRLLTVLLTGCLDSSQYTGPVTNAKVYLDFESDQCAAVAQWTPGKVWCTDYLIHLFKNKLQ